MRVGNGMENTYTYSQTELAL